MIKITTYDCKKLIHDKVSKWYESVADSPYQELVGRGTEPWKRIGKTTLAKFQEKQQRCEYDPIEFFVGLDKFQHGWCHLTANAIEDPKIIVHEFDLTDCNDNRLYGAVVATDPADKQFLGIAWMFDCAP